MSDFDLTMLEGDLAALASLVRKVWRERMVIVEVGCWKGLSAQRLAETVKPLGGKVYCIDHYRAYQAGYPDGFKRQAMMAFINNMIEFGLWDSICFMPMSSFDAARIFRNAVADLVFIDASHDYESVKSDILGWLPKVKPGGIICGHDYERNYHMEVVLAVEELLLDFQVCGDSIWYKVVE